jgi:hypothetical protein
LSPSYARRLLFIGGICDDGSDALADRLINEAIAIRRFAPHRYEDVPWLQFPGVVFEAGNGRIPVLR